MQAGPGRRGPAERLLGIGGRMLAALTAAVQTRVELLAVEMVAERNRLACLLLSALAIAVAALLGLAFTSFLVIAYFWDDHRLIAIAAVAAFYWAIVLGLGLMLRNWLDRYQRPFAATVETLRRDYHALLRSIGITPLHDKKDQPTDLTAAPDEDR